MQQEAWWKFSLWGIILGEIFNVSLLFHFYGFVVIITMVCIWVVLLIGWQLAITLVQIFHLRVMLLLSNMWSFQLISPPRHTLNCCFLRVFIRCHVISQSLWFWWTVFVFVMILRKPILLYGKWRILEFRSLEFNYIKSVVRIYFQQWSINVWICCHCIFLRMVIH